jgi:predicted small lipoprotein YifL
MKWCRAEMALYLIIAILGIGSMITACGQKGPLYKASINTSLEQTGIGHS